MVHSCEISGFSQTEQLGGFWLITLNLPYTTEPLAPFDIGCAFGFEPSKPFMRLFDQNSADNHYSLTLLSQSPVANNLIPDRLYFTPPTIDNISADGIENGSVNLLLLGSDLACANALYLAKYKKLATQSEQRLVLLHATEQFPFAIKPAQKMVAGLPPEAIGCSTLLEDWQCTNRLASNLGLPGCFDGDLSTLLKYWIEWNQTGLETDLPWIIICCAPKEVTQQCQIACQDQSWIKFTGVNYACLD